MSDPKVFGDGTLTIVVDQDGQTAVYSGQSQIGYIQNIKLEADVNDHTARVTIRFPSSDSENPQIEAYKRALVPLAKWIQIIS